MRRVQLLARTAVFTVWAVVTAVTVHALEPGVPLNQYGRTVWTADNGLSSAVYALAQDHDGYLWLGTDTGLIRFDGTDFVPWGAHGEDALAGSRVETILAARDGSLWVGFGRSGGINQIRNGKVVGATAREQSPRGYVTSLLEDRDGVIWAGGLEGVSRFHGGRWERLGRGEGLPDAAVQSLYEDPDGHVWVGTALGVFSSDGGASLFRQVSGDLSHSFAADSERRIWVTDLNNGLRRISGVAPQRAITPRVAGVGVELMADRYGTLWLGTRGHGLWRVRTNAADGVSAVERLSGPDWLTETSVLDLLEDRSGSIWVGTYHGLVRLSDSSVRMITSHDGLPAGPLQAVAVTDDGSVWVGTPNGLYRVSQPNGDRVTVRRELEGIVTALHADRHGTLWVATERWIYRVEHGRAQALALSPDLLKAHAFRIAAIVADHEDGIWLCDEFHGLLRWRNATLERPESVGRNPCSSAYVDPSGRLWFGFRNGTVASFTLGVFDIVKAPASVVGGDTSISGDPAGTVWINTPDGIDRFHDGRLQKVATTQLLPGALGPLIAGDDDRHLWTGTTAGIMQLSVRNINESESSSMEIVGARLFDAADGLLSHLNIYVVGSPAAARSVDGRLWFVTSNGLAMIDPRRLRGSSAAPQVWFDSVVIDDHTVAPQAQFTLAPGTRKLELKDGALSLSTPGGVHYRYMLEGFDPDWVQAGARRQAFYMNLPPRMYVFKVMASDSDGAWTGSPSLLTVTLRPAFYQSRVFYVVCGVGGLVLVCGIWWLRMRILKRQFAVVLAERARVGREMHDTLLQNLSSFTVELEVIGTQLRTAPDLVFDSLLRLRKQVTECIRETRESIWNLRSPRCDNIDFVTALRRSAESVAVGKDVQLRFNVMGLYRSGPPAVEDQLLRIAQEAMNNALRHAQPTVLSIELEYDGDSVFLRVSDDGKGFNVAEQRHNANGHWGLLSMRERAALVGGSFAVTSASGTGTQVETVVSFSPDPTTPLS